MKDLKAPLRIDFAGGWIDLPDFCKYFDGHVVNVAIRPHINLKDSQVDFSPYISGGGISSSTGSLILGQLSLMSTHSNENKIYTTPEEIAETVFKIENQMIGFKIGRQDQYAIGLGGLNVMRFGKNNGQKLDFEVVKHISTMDDKLKEFEESLLLVHSGIKRSAQNVVEAVRRNVAIGRPEHMNALKDIATCGNLAAKAIIEGEYYRLAKIMSMNWDSQKRFASETSNEQMDEVYEAMISNGAIGGKICGAGGGGYFVFCCKDKSQVKAEAERRGLHVIEPEFEMKDILRLNGLNPTSGQKKLLDLDEIEEVVLKLKANGKTIGFCSGCFDVLVAGHALFFSECKEKCDILIVSIGNDKVIKKIKGENRPINPEADRAFLLSSMSDVDYVILGEDKIFPGKIDFYNSFKKIKPDYFFLNDDDSAINEKKALAFETGSKLELVKRSILNLSNPSSSTSVIEKLKQKY